MRNELTVLNTIRSPLVLRHLPKDSRALVEELVHDAVLGRLFQVLEGVLDKAHDESGEPGLMISPYLND